MMLPLLVLALLATAGSAAAESVDPHQAEALFRAGAQAAGAGRLDIAEGYFRQLASHTPTPRVKLELARILFLIGRNRESLELFREVYEEPGTPAAVKRNVLPYVEELQLRLGRLRYSANIVTDSNPSRVADGGTFYFNGIPLSYEPPRKKETQYGIEPWVSYEKIWPPGIIGRFRGSARVFGDSELNSARIYSSFAKRLPQMSGMFVQASLDAEVQEDGTYGLPSLEAWKSFSPSDTVGLGIGGQAGYLFSENADASGTYIRPYSFADWAFGINATAFARASFESLDSRNDYYSYVAPRLEVGLDFIVGEAEFTPLVSVTSTRFRQHDPFWGVTREDLTIRASLTFSHERLSYRGITPLFTVFHEDRNSNIDIESYTQTGGSVSFRKLF